MDVEDNNDDDDLFAPAQAEADVTVVDELDEVVDTVSAKLADVAFFQRVCLAEEEAE